MQTIITYFAIVSWCHALASESCESGEESSLLQTRGSSFLAEGEQWSSGMIGSGSSGSSGSSDSSSASDDSSAPTCGGTAEGRPCKFPFWYKLEKYESCTTKDHDQPWCYAQSGGWGECCPPTPAPSVAPAAPVPPTKIGQDHTGAKGAKGTTLSEWTKDVKAGTKNGEWTKDVKERAGTKGKWTKDVKAGTKKGEWTKDVKRNAGTKGKWTKDVKAGTKKGEWTKDVKKKAGTKGKWTRDVKAGTKKGELTREDNTLKGLCDELNSSNCYRALDVAAAWENHAPAFDEQDVDRIVRDYHEGSVIQVFNDACDANGGGILTEHAGIAAIRRFFEDMLFTRLTPTPGFKFPSFSFKGKDYPNPFVEGGRKSGGAVTTRDNANVFLVWQSVDQGILKATDTFTWEETQGGIQIEKQHITVTTPQDCPAAPQKNPDAPVPDAGSPITVGWTNHFIAFAAQDRKAILTEYTDASEIRVWSWGGRDGDEPGFSIFTGLSEIGDMFDSWWADINSQTVDGSTGLAVPQGFPRIEVDTKSVFHTWSSYSNPKVTSTFLFDDQGRILRQTMVTTTGVAPKPP